MSETCSSRSDQVPNVCAGEPLTGDAWVARLRTPLEEAVAEEKTGYERGLAAGPKYPVCMSCIGWPCKSKHTSAYQRVGGLDASNECCPRGAACKALPSQHAIWLCPLHTFEHRCSS